MNRFLKLLAGAAVAAVSFAGSVHAASMYATGVWSTDDVVILDENFNEVSRFNAGASEPNGMAAGGGLIYSGHFATSEVVAYDLTGAEQFRWSGSFGNLQGMTLFGGEIVIANSGNFLFHNAMTGALTNTVAHGGGSSIEGLTTDGTNLYALNNNAIQVYNAATGALINSFANAANACSFDGTGITFTGGGNLALACTNGNWFEVSSADGSVINSGNNGLDMYGLTRLGDTLPPVPVPASLPLLLAGVGALGVIRRRKTA